MRIFIGYSQSNIENKSTPLVCKVLSYLDTSVAAEVEIKLGWVCYAGVNGGSRRNVATCTTLKNEKQENAETSNQSTSKKEWHVQAEQNALLFIVLFAKNYTNQITLTTLHVTISCVWTIYNIPHFLE